MESVMNQVRLWNTSNMECSYDCFCFENKKCSLNILYSFSKLYLLFTVAEFPDKNVSLQVHKTSPQNVMGNRDTV